jgi:hypothetical protein
LVWNGAGKVRNGEILERDTPRSKPSSNQLDLLERWSGNNPQSKIQLVGLSILERVVGDALLVASGKNWVNPISTQFQNG